MPKIFRVPLRIPVRIPMMLRFENMGLLTLILSVYFCSLPSFAADLNGVFMIVKGDVKVTSKAGGAPTAAKVGTKINVGDTVTSGPDSRGKIVMSDRNVINVSPDSKFLLAKYENNPVTGDKNVEMQLIAGKIRNNVEQTYDGEKSKFTVKTPTAVAGVRGTQFVTSFNPVSMATDVVTLKGAVTFAAVNPQGQVVGSPVTIQKGQTASAANGAPADPPKAVPKEDLKKMDSDTSASNKNSDSSGDQGGGEKVAGKEGGSKKESGEKEQAKSDAKSDSTADSGGDAKPGDAKSDGQAKAGADSDASSGGDRAPASADLDTGSSSGGAGVADASSSGPMIDSGDMDLGMANDIKNPVTATAPPPPPTLNLPTTPVSVPPPNPILTEIIRNSNTQTSLVIRPVSSP